jgi:hypothetical protein
MADRFPRRDENEPLRALRRSGETWRDAREHLGELPAEVLYALAARERLDTTARLVERLADERAPGGDDQDG